LSTWLARSAAGERLDAVNDVPQGVTVVGVIGQRGGVQHEQATGSPAIVGDDGGLHVELVRRGGLAFADALRLRGVERIGLDTQQVRSITKVGGRHRSARYSPLFARAQRKATMASAFDPFGQRLWSRFEGDLISLPSGL
jgi:hypothetical protein